MVKKKTKGQHRKAQLQQQNQQQEQRNHHKQVKKKGKSKQNIGNQRAGQQKDKEIKVKIPKKIETKRCPYWL